MNIFYVDVLNFQQSHGTSAPHLSVTQVQQDISVAVTMEESPADGKVLMLGPKQGDLDLRGNSGTVQVFQVQGSLHLTTAECEECKARNLLQNSRHDSIL